MCRSTGGIQLANTEEVARILGYGPDFSHERATRTVLDLATRGALLRLAQPAVASTLACLEDSRPPAELAPT